MFKSSIHEQTIRTTPTIRTPRAGLVVKRTIVYGMTAVNKRSEVLGTIVECVRSERIKGAWKCIMNGYRGINRLTIRDDDDRYILVEA